MCKFLYLFFQESVFSNCLKYSTLNSKCHILRIISNINIGFSHTQKIKQNKNKRFFLRKRWGKKIFNQGYTHFAWSHHIIIKTKKCHTLCWKYFWVIKIWVFSKTFHLTTLIWKYFLNCSNCNAIYVNIKQINWRTCQLNHESYMLSSFYVIGLLWFEIVSFATF